MLRRILVLALLALLLAALLFYSQMRRETFKVSGFLEAYEIRVGSRVGGRVAEVHAAEGDAVSAGALLVRLEPYDLRERLAQARAEEARLQAELDLLLAGYRAEEVAEARAELRFTEAQLEKLQNGPRPQEIEAAQARARLARSELELAQTRYQRVKSLFERNATSQEEMDRAITERSVADETAQVRQAELNLLLAGTRAEEIREAEARRDQAGQRLKLLESGYRREQIAQARAAVEAAQAATRAIQTQLDELTISAPSDAVVEAIELRPGDLVGAGVPVVSLMDRGELWVRAYVPEGRLSIALGQAVEVTVDSFPGARFRGHVSFIARQAEFTPGNVQTPEERSKQVFRIKVRLDDGLDRLRPGMIGDVWFDTTAEAAGS